MLSGGLREVILVLKKDPGDEGLPISGPERHGSPHIGQERHGSPHMRQ